MAQLDIAASLFPSSSSTRKRSQRPITKKISITDTPIRCELNILVKMPSNNGPRNEVSLPEKAKNPKNSLVCDFGMKRAMRERLADWLGPEKIPTRIPDAQKRVLFVANRAPNVATMRPKRLTMIVFFQPSLSSKKPMIKAPRPAVTFRTTPNIIISSKVKSKVPAA